MRRCPTCQSTYTNEALRFCLDDGTPLVEVSASGAEPPETLRIPPPYQTDKTEVFRPTEAFKPPVASSSRQNWLHLIIGGVLVLLVAVVAFGLILSFIIWRVSSRTSDGQAAGVSNNSNRYSNTNNSNTNNRSYSRADLLEELPVRIGDANSKVQQIYKPAGQPDYDSSIHYYYHFSDLGLWFFYDENMKIRTIRVEAPFRGKIDAIRIGDTEDTVREIKGVPDKTSDGYQPNTTALIYYKSERSSSIRFDIDRSSRRVVTIFM